MNIFVSIGLSLFLNSFLCAQNIIPIEASMLEIMEKTIPNSQKPANDLSTQLVTFPTPPLADSSIFKKSKEIKSNESVMSAASDEVAAVSNSPSENFQSVQLTAINGGFSFPADASGAVGLDHVMALHNSHFKIQGKSGQNCCIAGTHGSVNYPFMPLGNFFSPLNGFVEYPGCFDPRVIYLPQENKWIAIAVSGKTNQKSELLIAVSRSSNPDGTWLYYKINAQVNKINADPNTVSLPNDNLWADYPTIGYNKDWIVISANMFNGSAFVKSKVFVITKSEMINPTRSYLLTEPRTISKNSGTADNNSTGSMIPAITTDNSVGLFLVERWLWFGFNTWTLSGSIGYETIDNGKVTTTAEVLYTPFQTFGMPQSQLNKSYPWCAKQAEYVAMRNDTYTRIFSGSDDRVQTVLVKNNKLWVTHCPKYGSHTATTHVGINWYKMSPVQGWAPTIDTWGKIEDPNKRINYCYPSLAVNNNNDCFLSFTATSPDIFPSSAYAFKKSTDASFRDPYIYKAGFANYTIPQQSYNYKGSRWGDYSSACVDPNGIDFWALSQYAEKAVCGSLSFEFNPDRWATQWARLNTSNIIARLSINQLASIDNQLVYLQSLSIIPNPTNDVFSISGLTEAVNCKILRMDGVTIITKNKLFKEENSIEISALSSGMYFVILEYDNSRVIKKVVKQ